ncbi:DinB family protein [Dactylosporangium sp. NPDC006015]|uniref:DinB family protein n=1 Tax=Dactylosporangium sp. NPDC006015 TaxID=3154576 RepID=UPI0033A17EFD
MPDNVPPVADERSGLLAFLDQQRQGVRIAAFGLTDEQARLAPAASTLSVGGLVKHLAQMERSWVATMLQRPSPAVDYEDGFVLRADETLADVLADYVKAGEETDAAVAGITDMGQPVPVPKGVPWFPDDVDAWSVRWVLLHLIEETARHAGHADIVREAVDGATCWPLMAAAEGWPATPWVQPWQPASGTAQPV